MDIARTPLAGRQPENLGEDPFLAGETVAEEVGGAKASHVIATLKHYVANNQESERIGFGLPPAGSRAAPASTSSRPSGRCRRSTRRRSSAAIRRAGVDAVMCSYNRLNGPQTARARRCSAT